MFLLKMIKGEVFLPTTNNNIKNCPHPVATFRKSHLGFSDPLLTPCNPTPTSRSPHISHSDISFLYVLVKRPFTCLSTSLEKSDPSHNFWAHIKNSTIIP